MTFPNMIESYSILPFYFTFFSVLLVQPFRYPITCNNVKDPHSTQLNHHAYIYNKFIKRNTKMMKQIIYIEGSIGSGKSRFIEQLKEDLKDLKVQFIPEPLNIWSLYGNEKG